MIQSAIWVPPSLCGCQLRMTADFTDGSVVDGVSYRHPKPFTVTDLQVVSVCAVHQPQTLVMLDISGLYDLDPITGDQKQSRGYLQHPISNPTDAQCLYTFLSQYGGQTQSFPCGCKGHQFFDESKNVSYLDHPRHSRKCIVHRNDTKDMKKAASDFKKSLEAITL